MLTLDRGGLKMGENPTFRINDVIAIKIPENTQFQNSDSYILKFGENKHGRANDRCRLEMRYLQKDRI